MALEFKSVLHQAYATNGTYFVHVYGTESFSASIVRGKSEPDLTCDQLGEYDSFESAVAACERHAGQEAVGTHCTKVSADAACVAAEGGV
jgi:hypothetical protein